MYVLRLKGNNSGNTCTSLAFEKKIRALYLLDNSFDSFNVALSKA